MRSSRLRAIGGFAVSIVALILVIRGVDLRATADVLRTADFRWIALGTVFASGDLAFRGLRWQRLVHPIKAVAYLHMLGYLLIGYLMNNVLPARLGELVRSHYLGDREGISRASALGTVVVERVVDLVAVVTIASASLVILSIRGYLASAVLVGAGVTGLLLVGLAIGIAAHRLPGAERVRDFAERWPRLREAGRRLQDGLAVDKKLVALRPDDPTAHYNLACRYALLKQPDLALVTLRKAVELGYRDFRYMLQDQDLDSIRRDPRFKQLVREFGDR